MHAVDELTTLKVPYLAEKMISDGLYQSEKEFDADFEEFKNYLRLAKKFPNERLAMTSDKMDQLWHHFILFTREYHEFCNQYFGHYLHHQPCLKNKPSNDEDARRFMALYKKEFGKNSSTWKKDEHTCDGGNSCYTG